MHRRCLTVQTIAFIHSSIAGVVCSIDETILDRSHLVARQFDRLNDVRDIFRDFVKGNESESMQIHV